MNFSNAARNISHWGGKVNLKGSFVPNDLSSFSDKRLNYSHKSCLEGFLTFPAEKIKLEKNFEENSAAVPSSRR